MDDGPVVELVFPGREPQRLWSKIRVVCNAAGDEHWIWPLTGPGTVRRQIYAELAEERGLSKFVETHVLYRTCDDEACVRPEHASTRFVRAKAKASTRTKSQTFAAQARSERYHTDPEYREKRLADISAMFEAWRQKARRQMAKKTAHVAHEMGLAD